MSLFRKAQLLGQDLVSVSFAEVGSSLVTPYMTQRTLGTGVGVTQATSNLLITTGTSTNAEFLARSIVPFTGSAWVKKVKVIASQRIANQNLMVVMADKIAEGATVVCNSATSISVTKVGHGFTALNVGQFMLIGAINTVAGVPGRYAIASIPDANTINFTVAGWPASGTGTLDLFGWNHVKVLYNGTTATALLADAQRKGWASGDSTLTVQSSASPGHVMNTQHDGRSLFWSDYLVATSATLNVTSRGSRSENIPDDDVPLYLYIWSYNGTSAPATTTTWTIGFWSVERMGNVPVYIAGARLLGTEAPIPTQQVGTVTVTGTVNPSGGALAAGTNLIGDVGLQVRATAGGLVSVYRLLSSLATTNGAFAKASAGRVYKIRGYTAAAAGKWLKLYNKASAPTVGTDTPILTLYLPPTSVIDIDFGAIGQYFSTGIALAITGASPDADTTAVAVGDILGLNLIYA